MRDLLGGEKKIFFYYVILTSRRDGRVGGILSVRGPEVSLESLLVGTRHVQSPTPHAPGLGA